ncbi:FecR family protein [Chitinophaga vietnamensis]|uniref:FecR family protein n=1 Tax=Chitinophaga vietnamensis TaxID=2593957 RepID=UPI001177E252|nr:FecR family protein [Chitinophaga vietnamensis]
MRLNADTTKKYQGWLPLAVMMMAACQPNSAPATDPLLALQTPGVHYTTYQGETGRRTAVTLPDSSQVILNSASRLLVPQNFQQEKRTVLLDGDAWFAVKAAPQPFSVVSDKLTAAVLGTDFRMRSFSAQQGATVYLVNGKIKVSKSYHSTTDNQPEILERGQMILANKEIDLMEKETFHPEEAEAWRSDTLVIRDANTMALSRLLEDWFGVEVAITGDAAKARTITAAQFHHATLQEVLDKLSHSQDFTYKISGNKVTIRY